MIGIGITVGSIRPGRNGGQVAGWVREVATWQAGDEAVFDGYIFVTPEYNGGAPASPQNAIG